ncbi:MAG: hypothetical protein JSS02_29955 [Planctomycetes bacterium]|nr:hypothetical protein [Planctomycetota bacterium]
MNNICLDLAQRHVAEYTNESDRLMREHGAAMKCRDCEEFLQQGINAFKWLRQADDFLREADAAGVEAYTAELRETFDLLYKKWLEPLAFAEQWIQENVKGGYAPDNLAEFSQICEEAREFVETREWRHLSRVARGKLSAQEDW